MLLTGCSTNCVARSFNVHISEPESRSLVVLRTLQQQSVNDASKVFFLLQHLSSVRNVKHSISRIVRLSMHPIRYSGKCRCEIRFDSVFDCILLCVEIVYGQL